MEKVKIGILGLGAISGIYLKNLTTLFKETQVLGIYDLIPEKWNRHGRNTGLNGPIPAWRNCFRIRTLRLS